MTTPPVGDVEVTLSSELLRHLRAEARALGVSIRWLIASMVVDTVDTVETGKPNPPGPVAA